MRGYAITVAFELHPGTQDQFLDLVSRNARASVRAEPGCLRFDVLTPIGAAGGADVALYEIYVDRAAFEAHMASDHFRSFDAETRDLVRRKTVVEFTVAENAK